MSSITSLLHSSVDFPAEMLRGAARLSVSYLTEAAGLYASFILVENRRHHC